MIIYKSMSKHCTFPLLCMILLHFLFVREIVENEMTQVSIDNFKEIKQLKILWVL